MIPEDVRRWVEERWGGLRGYSYYIDYYGPIEVHVDVGGVPRYRADVPIVSEGYYPPSDWYRYAGPYRDVVEFDDNNWDVFRGAVAAADIVSRALRLVHPALDLCVYGVVTRRDGSLVCEGLNGTVVIGDGVYVNGRRFSSEEEALAQLPPIHVYSPIKPLFIRQPDGMDYYVFYIADRVNGRLISIYAGREDEEIKNARRKRDELMNELCKGETYQSTSGTWC